MSKGLLQEKGRKNYAQKSYLSEKFSGKNKRRMSALLKMYLLIPESWIPNKEHPNE